YELLGRLLENQRADRIGELARKRRQIRAFPRNRFVERPELALDARGVFSRRAALPLQCRELLLLRAHAILLREERIVRRAVCFPEFSDVVDHDVYSGSMSAA